MEKLVDYSFPVILFLVAPAANGLFLATGLRKRRERPTPWTWWSLMIITCATPAIILTLGITFRADEPRLHQDQQGASGQLLGFVVLGLLVALPLALSWTTNRLSDIGSLRLGVAIASLCIIPLSLIALIATAQMVSGVSL